MTASTLCGGWPETTKSAPVAAVPSKYRRNQKPDRWYVPKIHRVSDGLLCQLCGGNLRRHELRTMRGELFPMWLPIRRRFRVPDEAVVAYIEPVEDQQDVHVLYPAEPGEIWEWRRR